MNLTTHNFNTPIGFQRYRIPSTKFVKQKTEQFLFIKLSQKDKYGTPIIKEESLSIRLYIKICNNLKIFKTKYIYIFYIPIF